MLDILLIVKGLSAIRYSLLTIHRFWCILKTDVRPEGRADATGAWDATLSPKRTVKKDF